VHLETSDECEEFPDLDLLQTPPEQILKIQNHLLRLLALPEHFIDPVLTQLPVPFHIQLIEEVQVAERDEQTPLYFELLVQLKLPLL